MDGIGPYQAHHTCKSSAKPPKLHRAPRLEKILKSVCTTPMSLFYGGKGNNVKPAFLHQGSLLSAEKILILKVGYRFDSRKGKALFSSETEAKLPVCWAKWLGRRILLLEEAGVVIL